MSGHWSDERLGAFHDGALSAADAAAAERHLAECDACRARLAEIVALDCSLDASLEYDPGEAYFASFADRVSARIAAEAAPAAAAPAPKRGPFAWWNSPRSLAWAGGALALAAVAGLVVTLSRDHGPQQMATQVAPRREVGAGADAVAPRSAAPAPEATNEAPAPAAEPASPEAVLGAMKQDIAEGDAKRKVAPPAASGALADERRERAGTPAARTAPAEAVDRLAPPAPAPPPAAASLREQRTAPSGEPLPPTPRVKAEEKLGAQRTPAANGFARAPAAPAVPAPVLTKSLAGNAARADAPVSRDEAAARASAESATPAQPMRQAEEESAGLRLCGTVTDTEGRPVAHAAITIAETGSGTVSGADGAFCLDVARANATLSVLGVGFQPYRASVGLADNGRPVAVRLIPVKALEAPGTPGTGNWGGLQSFRTSPPAPGARAATPVASRTLALAASTAAARLRTPAGWDTAAQAWSGWLAAAPTDAGRLEARFKLAEARVQAWRLETTPARRATAQGAVNAYLDVAPAGALRDLALRWRAELQP